jgi:anti-sigma factor ChrR (cupin superfamily)
MERIKLNVINEQLGAGVFLPRHKHAKPYVTLVLEGRYLEAGDHGRFTVSSGDILMRGPYHDLAVASCNRN